jgi:antitoxin FitA
MHNAAMPVSITIRNVPDETRNELAARAALSGRSLQEYLLARLIELAATPDNATLMARVRERVTAMGTVLSPEKILECRDADRR